MKIRILVTKEGHRYWAEVLGIPGLVSGATKREAADRARAAAVTYFEVAAEELPLSQHGEESSVVDARV
jgi:predicted RNase H-like HicB family nuclease